MAIVKFRERAAPISVDDYVRSQKPAGRPISTREAVQVLRAARIKCYISDRELAEMVAATAISHGRDVIFDWTATED
jgi:hypothetical protein